MKHLLLHIFVIGMISSPALAQHTIECDGTESTGSGVVDATCGGNPRHYAYPVAAVDNAIEAIQIGTDDCREVNYTNICMPAGWTFSVNPNGFLCDTIKTPHGGATNAAASGTCGCAITFQSGGAPDFIASGTSFTFGFDNNNPSHDVQWDAIDQSVAGGNGETFGENAGDGIGPVHGPSAPPIPTVSTWGIAAMVLLVLVTGTIVFRRKTSLNMA